MIDWLASFGQSKLAWVFYTPPRWAQLFHDSFHRCRRRHGRSVVWLSKVDLFSSSCAKKSTPTTTTRLARLLACAVHWGGQSVEFFASSSLVEFSAKVERWPTSFAKSHSINMFPVGLLCRWAASVVVVVVVVDVWPEAWRRTVCMVKGRRRCDDKSQQQQQQQRRATR